jgi:flagella basal body P-ring formation protein FlgA
MKTLTLLMTPLMIIVLNTAWAQDFTRYHDHDEILTAAKQHLLNQSNYDANSMRIHLTPLDHRIKLARCASPLQTSTPSYSDLQGKTTVEVKCNTPKPWKLYVTARVGIEAPVVIAKRDLKRGTAIGTEDVRLVTQDTSHLLRGHFESLAQVLGRTLKRDLRRDQVITPGLLVVQKTISRGQLVTILAGHSGIEVRMRGKALRNGNPGDLIPVQNLSSKKRLQARVVASGEVRIE